MTKKKRVTQKSIQITLARDYMDAIKDIAFNHDIVSELISGICLIGASEDNSSDFEAADFNNRNDDAMHVLGKLLSLDLLPFASQSNFHEFEKYDFKTGIYSIVIPAENSVSGINTVFPVKLNKYRIKQYADSRLGWTLFEKVKHDIKLKLNQMRPVVHWESTNNLEQFVRGKCPSYVGGGYHFQRYYKHHLEFMDFLKKMNKRPGDWFTPENYEQFQEFQMRTAATKQMKARQKKQG